MVLRPSGTFFLEATEAREEGPHEWGQFIDVRPDKMAAISAARCKASGASVAWSGPVSRVHGATRVPRHSPRAVSAGEPLAFQVLPLGAEPNRERPNAGSCSLGQKRGVR